MMSKTELRSEYRRRRELLSEDTRDVLSGQAVSQLLSLPEIKNAKVIFCYISFGAELSTLALLESLLAAGKIVCVPHISGKEMLPMSFSGLKECTVGHFGILEPVGGRFLPQEEIDVCIAPGLAFDRRGNRLGYGKGYYDRFFASFKGVRIGLCFDFQIVDRVPAEDLDQELGLLVSERGIYYTEVA